MSNLLKKIKSYILSHKIISTIIAIVLLGGGYWLYGKLTSTSGETRYIVADVQKGTIVSSITGSGQVSTSNQISLKTKATGDVVYIGVTNGQAVRTGTLVAELDAKDAEKAVRDAQLSLDSAKLQLEKLKGPDALTTPRNKQQAQDDLAKAYNDGFNTVSNAFLDLPSVISGLQGVITGDNIAKGQWNADYFSSTVKQYDDKVIQFRDDAYAKYQTARAKYDQNFLDYKNTDRSADRSTIDTLIKETYDTTVAISEAVKSANNLIQFYEDKLKEKGVTPTPQADVFLTQLSGFTDKTNAHMLNLLTIESNIKTSNDAVLNADLDVSSQELVVKQKENALLDAQTNLSNYFVRAPFDGTIAQLNVKKFDSLSSGSAVATLITRQKIAEISLNEVDAAKVKVGQKVNLTFDAVDGLNITGEVSEIDTVGTVSQGVVSYTVKIVFDTQDDRVKSGMSVSAAIIIDVKQDVLVVANSAIKSQGNNQYVQIFDPKLTQLAGTQQSQGIPSTLLPKQQAVTTGLSNDTQIEITAGLKEGDQVVVRAITSTQTTTATAPSLFGGGGGGAGRALGR